MPGKLQDKVALITGGGTGIGRAICHKFVVEGAKVICVDIDEEAGQRTAAMFATSAMYVRGNVAVEGDWVNAIGRGVELYGKIDIVVNNAGIITESQPAESLPEAEFDRLMNINVKQYYMSCRSVVPYFRRVGGGVFVNLSSVGAVRPRPGLVWYGASKAAVSATTKGLAAEYAKDFIRVNAICPVVTGTQMYVRYRTTSRAPLTSLRISRATGGKDTPENRATIAAGIPLGRLATVEDVANAASFLASDEASFITGIDLLVDGGRALQ
ncbi:hypothetical protein LTR22_024481 [Elasticomyces elasticus]|nr:hypothetical protein LTR22_024481 [Elasticomyces elasticus]